MSKLDPGFYTYCHEHIHIDLSHQKNTDDCFLNQFELLSDEMILLKGKGVKNIIEVTNKYMGRNVEFVEKISERTEVNILMSTGYYIEGFFPDFLYSLSDKEIAKSMIDEIIYGMDGTNKKASLIGEIGSSELTFSDTEKKVFRAAAIANIETGVPISTHTSFSSMGKQQVNLLLKYGVDSSNITIGHCDLKDHFDELLWLLDKGCSIQFDTIGKNNYYPDDSRADTIIKLIDLGYVKQIMLSMDITRRSHLLKNGGLGFSYLIDKFVPLLIRKGANKSDIDFMLKINPATFFKN